MPNLFVSIPMRGRDEIDIHNEMEDLLELVEEDYGMEFDLLDTYEHGNPPDDIRNENMWYLARSIDMLTMADFVIFAPGWKNAPGCIIEHMVCAMYDIPYAELHVPEIPNLENAEVIMDYTHDLDEQPVEIVDKIDILHRDDDDSMDGNESLAEPEFDDEDYLEPGEYDADIDIPDEDELDEDKDNILEHHGIKGQQWGVRQGPPYPLHRSSEYDTAKDIYDKLDKFDYGCIINGKRYNETNLDKVDWSKYKTTPVDIFEKTKIGTCWDFTNYQHEKFKEAGVDHTTRMIVMDTEDGPVTHTFTTFKDSKGQNYWLEQALYSERGIRPIDDYHDAVDVISKRYDSTGKRPYDVYEFNPDGMDKGLGDQEFFNKATSGDPIFQRKEVNNTSTAMMRTILSLAT